MLSLFKNYKKIVKTLEKENKELIRKVKLYEDIIKYCNFACLCERDKTKGFNYNEKHPKLNYTPLARYKTPKEYINKKIKITNTNKSILWWEQKIKEV
jgi:hypothetical protein